MDVSCSYIDLSRLSADLSKKEAYNCVLQRLFLICLVSDHLRGRLVPRIPHVVCTTWYPPTRHLTLRNADVIDFIRSQHHSYMAWLSMRRLPGRGLLRTRCTSVIGLVWSRSTYVDAILSFSHNGRKILDASTQMIDLEASGRRRYDQLEPWRERQHENYVTEFWRTYCMKEYNCNASSDDLMLALTSQCWNKMSGATIIICHF